MTKGHPDILLYKLNLIVTSILCIAVAAFCWLVWKHGLSVDIGEHVVGFHAQKLLGLDFATYLANEFERLLALVLMFSVPLLGVSSLFLYGHDYDILWWSPWRPRSARLRIHAFFLLFLSSFASSYLLSDLCGAILSLLPLTAEENQFYAVAAIATAFFPMIASITLFAILGFINAFEKSRYERTRQK